MKIGKEFQNDANIQIVPSILVQTEADFKKQIKAVDGAVNQVQLDIADGVFVPNATWGNPGVVNEVAPMPVELHLMVSDPLEEVKKWTKCKRINRVLVHFETLRDPKISLKELRGYDWEVGLVLNPETAPSAVESLLPHVDVLMFMGVHPGFQGQEFIVATADKIEDFKKTHEDVTTALDGGVNEKSLSLIVTSHVDIICPGSAIFDNGISPKENVRAMHAFINTLTEQGETATV